MKEMRVRAMNQVVFLSQGKRSNEEFAKAVRELVADLLEQEEKYRNEQRLLNEAAIEKKKQHM